MRRHRVLTFLLVIVMLVGVSACRSKAPKPTAPVAAPEAPAARTVPSPSTEFVSPASDLERNPVSSTELNRVARERGWIQDAFFAYDSNTLDADAQAALSTSARWLRENSNVRVTVEGHCDERGTEQYNLALGDRRAHTARQYLAALGVDPARMSQVSYGEERPFEEGSHEAAWRQNRRAHLVIQQP